MAWVILPYQGAGPIKLGMTPHQVEKEIGPLDSSRSSGAQNREEFRALELPIVTYNDTGVTEITFSRQAKAVSFQFIDDIFTADPLDVLREVESQDGNLRETMGIIVSIKFGISLSGFHDDDEYQKTVSIFKKRYLG